MLQSEPSPKTKPDAVDADADADAEADRELKRKLSISAPLPPWKRMRSTSQTKPQAQVQIYQGRFPYAALLRSYALTCPPSGSDEWRARLPSSPGITTNIVTSTTTIPSPVGSRFERALSITSFKEIAEPQPAVHTPLNNPVHPLFSYNNFRATTPRQAYKNLLPALRLATLFLTSSSTLPFWCRLLYGEVVPAPNEPRETFLREVVISPSMIRRARDDLVRCRGKVVFRWEPEDEEIGRYGQCKPSRAIKGAAIYLAEDFLHFANSAEFERVDFAQRLRFWFFFAMNMTHELAHGMMYFREPWPAGLARSEPWYSAEGKIRELGDAWEEFVVGGKVQPVGMRCDCEEGLLWYPVQIEEARGRVWARRRSSVELACERGTVFWAIAMAWIRDVLGVEGWSRRADRQWLKPPDLVGVGALVPGIEDE